MTIVSTVIMESALNVKEAMELKRINVSPVKESVKFVCTTISNVLFVNKITN